MTRPLLIAIFFLALTACSGSRIGTGWSRAPDLSVYAAMDAAGEMAREQDVLCSGGNPAVVVDRWRARFGAREDWIAAALAARHGRTVVDAAERPAVGRERCPLVSERKWHRHHGRMLKLLELRLYPADHWNSGR